ncbi:hypothetical protein T484DRAFT_1792806, partial [Baffinella frigidus]
MAAEMDGVRWRRVAAVAAGVMVCVAALAVVTLSAEGISGQRSTGRSALAAGPDLDAPGGTSYFFGSKAGKARVALATKHLAARQQQLQEAEEPAEAGAAPAEEEAAPAAAGEAAPAADEGVEAPAAAAAEEAPGAEGAAPAGAEEAAGEAVSAGATSDFSGAMGENSQASYNLKRLNAVVNKIGNADREYQEVDRQRQQTMLEIEQLRK